MLNVLSLQLDHMSACAWLRLYAPLIKVDELEGCAVDFAVKNDGQNTLLSFSVNQVDIAIFQRHFKIDACSDVFYSLLINDIPIIFDIDDNLLNLPLSHPDKVIFDDLEEHTLLLLSIADVVTVSTPELKKLYAPFCKRVEIIPNHVDPKLWDRSCRWSFGEKVIMGYAGSATHHKDLEMIEDVLINLMDEYPDKVETHFWGFCSDRLRKHPSVVVKSTFTVDYNTYAKECQKGDLDIALAPLVDNVFNRGKSAIKWYEYSIGSVPGVYSRIPSYENLVDQGENGFLCEGDTAEWYRCLKELIENKELRQKMGDRCRSRVIEKHSLDNAATSWEDLLFSLPPKKVVQETLPLVSIIIPIYNRSDLTRQCLRSIFDTPSQVSFEVIVVDNASQDDSVEMLREFAGKIRLIRFNKNAGYSKANNRAADVALGQLLVMLNNDTVVQEHWLDALVRCHQETGAHLVGARLYYPDASLQHAGIAIYPHDKKPHVIYCGLPSEHPDFEKLTGIRRPFQMLTAACWLVTRESWKSLKGFDEAFVNGYEDLDFCLRLGESGGVLMYEPQAKVIHYESQSPGRGQHTTHNEELLFSRWRHKWNYDLDVYLSEDGMQYDSQKGFFPKDDWSILEANLNALFERNKELSEKMLLHRSGWGRRFCEVLKGPSVKVMFEGKWLTLHSIRDPKREAQRLAKQCLKEHGREKIFGVLGFGFGWHVEALLEKLPEDAQVNIKIVDDLIFHLALESRDLSELISDPRVTFVDSIDKINYLLPVFKGILN